MTSLIGKAFTWSTYERSESKWYCRIRGKAFVDDVFQIQLVAHQRGRDVEDDVAARRVLRGDIADAFDGIGEIADVGQFVRRTAGRLRIPVGPKNRRLDRRAARSAPVRSEDNPYRPTIPALAQAVARNDRLHVILVELVRRKFQIRFAVFLPDREQPVLGLRARGERCVRFGSGCARRGRSEDGDAAAANRGRDDTDFHATGFGWSEPKLSWPNAMAPSRESPFARRGASGRRRSARPAARPRNPHARFSEAPRRVRSVSRLRSDTRSAARRARA